MKITLPIYYIRKYKTKKDKKFLVWLNRFRNAHFFEVNEVKKHYHDLVQQQVTWSCTSMIYPVYNIYIKSKNTDYHNVRSIIEKFVLDWLVACWYIVDDSFDYVKSESTNPYIDKENPRCEIFINETP